MKRPNRSRRHKQGDEKFIEKRSSRLETKLVLFPHIRQAVRPRFEFRAVLLLNSAHSQESVLSGQYLPLKVKNLEANYPEAQIEL